MAIADVYEGKSRAEAARISGVDRQTLGDWVHQFNTEGPDGLKNREGPGVDCRLNAEHLAKSAVRGETQPELECDSVARWRRSDLVQVIEERFGVVYAKRTICSFLARLGFAHMAVRPRHPKQGGTVIADYKKFPPAL